MFTVLTGFLGFLAALIAASLLLSHISWWLLGEMFFPSSRVCAYVHWNFASWFAREAQFFTKHLEKVTVFGFIFTLLLCAIVPLNVTILAQIFDLFVENEQTIILPILGEYGVFPLLVGLLFALVEVALSAVVDFRKSLKQKYSSITFVLAVMVILEVGLNTYRSSIMAGDPGIDRTFWDNILGISGPLLAGFLGLVVPLATIILGSYAMMDFIVPMVNNVAVGLRSLFLFTLYGVLVLLFGWHPKTPLKVPESVRRLNDEAGRFMRMGDNLRARFKTLQSAYQRLKKPAAADLPGDKELEAMSKAVEELELQAARKKPARSNQADFVYYNDVHSRPVLRRIIDEIKDEIREWKSSADAEKRRMARIGQGIKRAQIVHNEQQASGEQYEAELEPVMEQMTALEQGMREMRIIEFAEAIQAAMNLETVKSAALSPAEVEELQLLVNPPKTATRQQRDYARATADLCRTMVSTARTEIHKAAKVVQDVQSWLDKHAAPQHSVDPSSMERRIEELSIQLVELANRVEKSEQAIYSRFDAMQKELRALAWQLYAFIKWFELQTPLRKRV